MQKSKKLSEEALQIVMKRRKTKSKGKKERYYMLIKWSIQKEDITIVNIYAPSTGAPQYIRQTLTDVKGKLTVTQ